MSNPNSPLRAPPLNASDMGHGHGQPQRCDSNGSPTMLPRSAPVSQPDFITPRGEPCSKETLISVLNRLHAAKAQGKQVSPGIEHEALWILQQRYPTHPVLQGRCIPPPKDTLPHLRHVGQRTGQAAPGQPQASSPNMLPLSMSRPAGHGAERSHGMTIDPALADSSMTRPQNAMSPMQMRPSSGTPGQGPASFSSAATSFVRSPLQKPTPALSRTPSAMSFTPGSPAAFVFQNDQSLRSPSKVSLYRPGQAQYSPPLTPGRPAFSPAPGGASLSHRQNPPPPQNDYTAGSVSSRSMFAAPPSQPASAQPHSGQVQSSGQLNVSHAAHHEHVEDTSLTNAQQLQAPEVQAMIDARMPEALKMCPTNATAQYVEWMGNDYQRKMQFVQAVMEKCRRMKQRNAQASNAPRTALQVDSRRTASGPAGNKRKGPHTAVEQPKSKRRIVDLTEDDPPSVSPPSGPIKNPPIPTHLIPRPANADAHEHALEHGVYLPDLCLRTYSKREFNCAKLVHRQHIHNALSALDPVPQNLKDLVRSAKKMVAQTAVPATDATTAMEDVRVEPGDVLSESAATGTASSSFEQPSMQEDDSVRGDRSSSSPEVIMGTLSEQRADLEYELSFFQHDGDVVCY